MRIIKTEVLIIGGGAAGLNTALNIKGKSTMIIERTGSNSLLCPWNLMLKPKKELKKNILETGINMNEISLVNTFLEDYKIIIKDLKKLGIKFRKSNIGIVPDYPFPGSEVRKIFIKKLNKKNVKILKGEIQKFLTTKNNEIIGIEGNIFSSKEKIRIFFNDLILAGGGLSGFFQFTTGSVYSDGSILSLCHETNFKMRDLEFFMFHPFLIVDKRLPRALVSGDILTKMEYEDEKGNNFLSRKVSEALKINKHHHIFPQMVKEFYFQSLKSQIYGKLICSEEWFKEYQEKNEFGFIFKNLKVSDIKKIKIHPAFHFSIGGLVINKNSQTSKKNVYAAGEITGGLHGYNRIGGLAILEALTFGKRAALDINKKIKRNILIPDKFKKVGKLGFSNKRKKEVWKTLGPIKNKKILEKIKKELKEKRKLTSQEKLFLKIIELSLIRKNSVGSFYRDDFIKI